LGGKRHESHEKLLGGAGTESWGGFVLDDMRADGGGKNMLTIALRRAKGVLKIIHQGKEGGRTGT